MIRAHPCRNSRQLKDGKMPTHQRPWWSVLRIRAGRLLAGGEHGTAIGRITHAEPAAGGCGLQAAPEAAGAGALRTVLQETMREVNLLLNCNTPSHLQNSSTSLQEGCFVCLGVSFRGFLGQAWTALD